MDNFGLDVTCKGRPAFDLAMQLAFMRHKSAAAYRVTPTHGLVFSWHSSARESLPLPCELDWQGAADLAWRWLEVNRLTGDGPDHDGHNSQGWRVYVEGWGHVDHCPYAIVAIKPAWAMHGK